VPVDVNKSLTDQVSEIEKLIFDAQQQLSQASYALETLKQRIADPREPDGRQRFAGPQSG
jgi:hypothetical protein